MSKTAASLRHKINSADDLKGVVRTMKVLAASSISQYEDAVTALNDYHNNIEIALGASLRAAARQKNRYTHHMQYETLSASNSNNTIHAIVFGSDQGLVGQFNEDLASFVCTTLATLPGQSKVWVVGDQVYTRLYDAGVNIVKSYAVPSAINTVANLVGELLLNCEMQTKQPETIEVYVFYNQSQTLVDNSTDEQETSLYQPIYQRLLPLDKYWQNKYTSKPWPTSLPPEMLCTNKLTLSSLLSEYLFISIFKACAESLANENASRMAAMQRAEKNIDELRNSLLQSFHRLRQSGIDEELNDVLAGYNFLKD